MSQEQIQDLIVVEGTQPQNEAPVENMPELPTTHSRNPPRSPTTHSRHPSTPQKNEPLEDPIKDDRAAADILSAPAPDPQALPQGTTGALKTRAQLISKIKEVCAVRGVDAKQYNLHRRRKNSLQEIVRTQFAEAAEENCTPQVDPEIEEMMGDSPRNITYAVQMMYRLDLTVCRLLEGTVDWTSQWHGMTAGGFAEGIDDNPHLSVEIKSCWEEILQDPENEWVTEYCTAGSRLALAHMYGLLNVLRKQNTIEHHDVCSSLPPTRRPRVKKNPLLPPIGKPPPKEGNEASKPVAPRGPSGKLQHLAMLKQARGKNVSRPRPMPAGAGGLVLTV
jgi:hypothetical protein